MGITFHNSYFSFTPSFFRSSDISSPPAIHCKLFPSGTDYRSSTVGIYRPTNRTQSIFFSIFALAVRVGAKERLQHKVFFFFKVLKFALILQKKIIFSLHIILLNLKLRVHSFNSQNKIWLYGNHSRHASFQYCPNLPKNLFTISKIPFCRIGFFSFLKKASTIAYRYMNSFLFVPNRVKLILRKIWNFFTISSEQEP